MSILALTSNTLTGTAAAGQIEYNGQFYATDSNASRGQLERLVQGTAQNSTSGTSIDFTGIPAWAKRITVMFNGVSTSGTSIPQIQVGSGSVTTTGYLSGGATTSTAAAFSTSSTGLLLMGSQIAASTISGSYILTLISGNTWVFSGTAMRDTAAGCYAGGNSPALGGALDRVRITTVNGTDTFDAGSINIMYEG